MAKVEGGKLEKLDHLDRFAVDEEGAAPEHDPSEGENIEASDD